MRSYPFHAGAEEPTPTSCSTIARAAVGARESDPRCLPVLGRWEPEALAQHRYVVPVDLTQVVSGVVPQSELGTFTSH